jgi:TP901 family phage tail tape measure protein
MPARSSDISVRLRLRGQRQFKREVTESTATLEAMGLRGAKALGAFARQSQRLKDFGRNWTRNVSLPLAVGGGLAVKAAIDWESAFAGVEKTIDATPAQFRALEGSLRSMSTHIPVAANELAGIAEAAGQLGIKRSAIMGFTRTVADLGVATNLAGEEGASTLARFANISQMPQSQFDRLGSTIVALGNAGASTEKEIAAMGLRLAAAGSFAGMSEANVLAIANALSSVGIEAEAGGTAMSTAIKTINSSVVGNTPLLEDFAAIAGTTGQQFAQSWKRDAAGTMTSWIEGLARLKAEGKDIPSTLYDLGTTLRGTRVQDTLMRAAGAGDLLRESLGLGTKAWRDNNALSHEATKRYQTVASKLQILKNQVIDLGVTIGQELLPALIDFVGFAGPKLSAIAKWFGGLDKSAKRTVLGVIAFGIALGPLASVLGYFAGGVGRTIILLAKFMRFAAGFRALAMGVGIINALKIAMLGFGITLRGVMMTTGIGLAITAIILLNEQFHFLGPTIEWVTNALGVAFDWIKAAVTSVIGFVKSNWKLILIGLTGPIGLAVALIIKYWGTIKRAVSNAVQAVLGFVRSHWKTIVAILAGPIGIATRFVLDHWGQIKSAAQSVVSFVITKFNAFVSFFTGLPGRMLSVGKGIFTFVKEGFRSAINWVIDKWNALHFSVPSVDLGPLGSIGGQTINFPDMPRLAAGGNIARSGAVEVGEAGPEILQLPRGARVTPLDPRPFDGGAFGGGGHKTIRVPLYIGAKMLAEAVAEYAEDDAATA